VTRELDTAGAVLADLRARAGASGGPVVLRDADPVLPTRFRVGELGAAVIAAAASQAARLFELRTGRRQEVAVDVDAAAAAMRSFRYLRRLEGGEAKLAAIPSAFYRTADDRRIFLHRASPEHLARQLAVLGTSSDEEAIVAAISRWRADDLEAAIMDAGACAAVVRTRAEWAAHPQGRAVASLPLFRIERIGDSDPIPVGDGVRPLGGVRVLDLTRVLAGPTNARTLAEHGADVLRVGSPLHPDDGGMVMDTGHGKRSTVLDLRRDADADALRRLIAGADVFSQGYRPGAIGRLGFTPGEVAELRPGIVSVAISAFGAEGPWREARGFDSVVEAANGMADEEGRPGAPRLIPASPLDYASGYLAAFLVQVALERRATEGGSYHIELSLAQTAAYLDALPRLDAVAAAERPSDLPAERVDALSTESETPYGRLRHLAPVARLSVTPAHWSRPSVPLDHDSPRW